MRKSRIDIIVVLSAWLVLCVASMVTARDTVFENLHYGVSPDGRQMYMCFIPGNSKFDTTIEQAVERFHKEGYKTTTVAYGQGKWWLVIGTKSSNLAQREGFGSSLASAKRIIEDHWDKGFGITTVGYGEGGEGGKWVIMGSKPGGSQAYNTPVNIPEVKTELSGVGTKDTGSLPWLMIREIKSG